MSVGVKWGTHRDLSSMVSFDRQSKKKIFPYFSQSSSTKNTEVWYRINPGKWKDESLSHLLGVLQLGSSKILRN